MIETLSYPIGEFDKNIEVNGDLRAAFINDIAERPARVREAVEDLSDEQLNTPYRPDGWSVRQTVHHIADSHLNAYIRFKWALTEDAPTIKAYYEDRWAELSDSKMPVEYSLKLLESLHSRWVELLKSMSDEDFQRTLIHPDSGDWTLAKMLGLYAWHGKHHTAHITKLREEKDW